MCSDWRTYDLGSNRFSNRVTLDVITVRFADRLTDHVGPDRITNGFPHPFTDYSRTDSFADSCTNNCYPNHVTDFVAQHFGSNSVTNSLTVKLKPDRLANSVSD